MASMMRALFAPLSLSLAARARSVRRARAAPPAQIFSKYDADSSNTIDLQELTLALTDLFGKCPYSAEELNALVAQVDENANGELEVIGPDGFDGPIFLCGLRTFWQPTSCPRSGRR